MGDPFDRTDAETHTTRNPRGKDARNAGNAFKTRLIADVVTGKVDVREAAVNLPDEPEELLENGQEMPEDADTLSEEAAA